MKGLSDTDLQSIRKVVKEHPKIEQVILFGSRATNTHKNGSDVDLAIKGEDLKETAMELQSHLNERSLLPYYFDVVDYPSITHNPLRDHIDQVGIVIYTRPPTSSQ